MVAVENAPVYCTLDDVRTRLRLPVDHPDLDYLDDCRMTACHLIAQRLDVDLTLPDTWPPPWPSDPAAVPYPVHRAAIGVTIRVYRFKDAESDVSEGWDGAAPLRIPRDPLAGYRDLLAPYVTSWGYG